MKKLSSILFSCVAAMIVVVVTPLAHVSAMQAHDTHGGGMSTNMSQHCATPCSSPSAKEEDSPESMDRKDEDEPAPPYYLQFQSAQTGFRTEKVMQARDVDVPTNVPLYRFCCVIRR